MGSKWELVDAITHSFAPTEESAQTIIDRLLPKLKYQDLAAAIIARDKYLYDTTLTAEQKQSLFLKFDPISALFTEFDLNKYRKLHYFLRKSRKPTGKSWWDYISDYLQRPDKVIKALSKTDSNIYDLLNTKEGIEYVKYLCKTDYDFFYRWTWFFPRKHKGCNGWIKYGKKSHGGVVGWTFYCSRCGVTISNAQIERDYNTEEITYKYIKKKKTKH